MFNKVVPAAVRAARPCRRPHAPPRTDQRAMTQSYMMESLETRLALSVVYWGGAGGTYQVGAGVTASVSEPLGDYRTSSGSVSLNLSGLPAHSALRISAETPWEIIDYGTDYSGSTTLTADGTFAGETEQTSQDPPSWVSGRGAAQRIHGDRHA